MFMPTNPSPVATGAFLTAPFLTAQWRHLVMLNYEVDPALLTSRVPRGTELDVWNGRTFVSLVGFRFLDTRVLGWRIPFHTNFDEVNLRFYVRHRSGDEWRRGVVFVKEIVPRTAIALVARWAYNEQYVALPMRSEIELPSDSNAARGSMSYSWKWAGRWSELRAQVESEPSPKRSSSPSITGATPHSAMAQRSNTAWNTLRGASGPPPRATSTATWPRSTAPSLSTSCRTAPAPPSSPKVPRSSSDKATRRASRDYTSRGEE